ncbi:MAG: Sua5/YciO/YrdC/YwlC family protein [Armatimonadetes bacterium]|nr:Sua5/YciO/YrdC/YwlC family protein [Armatimonadota bacterium]
MKVYNEITKVKYFEDSVFLHHTGNMFGIGCSVFSKKGIQKINVLKQKKENRGYIVLIPELDWLDRFCEQQDVKIRKVLQQYWPGNLTVLLAVKNDKLSNVTFNNKVAFRIPSSSFLRQFIKEINEPIISTSINVSNESPINNLKQILKEKKEWFDFAVLPKKEKKEEIAPSTITDFSDNKLSCIREGSIEFQKIKESYLFPKILFICTANICRSPMAQYLTKEMLKKNHLTFRVSSAGFLEGGFPISKGSDIVLSENNIDASMHISQKVNRQLKQDSFLILTMTEMHKQRLLELEPNAVCKVFTLSEYCDFSIDIDDPFGLDVSFYRETFKKIKMRLEVLIKKIID